MSLCLNIQLCPSTSKFEQGKLRGEQHGVDNASFNLTLSLLARKGRVQYLSLPPPPPPPCRLLLGMSEVEQTQNVCRPKPATSPPHPLLTFFSSPITDAAGRNTCSAAFYPQPFFTPDYYFALKSLA